MTIPIKNQILDKIKEKPGITDKELSKLLAKESIIITEDAYNKVLLNLEIMGLISVSWMTKDTKRIEVITTQEEDDEYKQQVENTDEKDYEASFPGTDQ